MIKIEALKKRSMVAVQICLSGVFVNSPLVSPICAPRPAKS